MPAMVNNAISLPEAFESLFNRKLSAHPKGRTTITTLFDALIKAKLLDKVSGPLKRERESKQILRGSMVLFHNAVLLQAIYAAPKEVIKIFKDEKDRQQMTAWAKSLLLQQQSVAGIGLLAPELPHFFDLLESGADLGVKKLPNPFVELPQLALDGSSSLMQRMVVQAAVLSAGDSMMLHYFNGDLEAAKHIADTLPATNGFLERYRLMIIDRYAEADEFDQLLDDWT
jgi:hypothetical protein